MKKLFTLLFLAFLCIILLAGCVGEPSEEISGEPSKSSSSFGQNESSSENHSEINPTVTYIGKAEDIEVYKKAVETGEMRLDIVYGRDGIFNTTKEVPATEYWIIDDEGNLLIEHPFYDLRFWEGNELFEIEPYIYSGIEGCYQGNKYMYSFLDGKFELVELKKAGKYENDGNPIPSGFQRIRYTYGSKNTYHGLIDSDGKIIFEPVYSYIQIPFEDRFVVGINNMDYMDTTVGFFSLTDTNGNVLCTYTNIKFFFFDDGSYLGIAWYSGYGEKWGHILYDKNGNLLVEGYRFIDKDGNELSPCFDSDYLEFGFSKYVENHLDEIITTTDENGNTLEFTGRDFIREL